MADFDPDQWLAQTAPTQPASAGFDPDKWLQDTDSYWGDVQRNAKQGLRELPGMVEGMGNQALKIGKAVMPGSVVQSGMDVLAGKPAMETSVGEGAKALYDVGKGALGGAWQGLKDTGSLAKMPFEMMLNDELPLEETEFAQKFRERPFGAPLGVAGTVGGGLSALKAFRGARAGAGAAGAVGEGLEGAADDVARAGIPKEAPIPGEGPIPEPGVPPKPGTEAPAWGKAQLDELDAKMQEKFGRAKETKGLTQGLGKSMEQKGRGMILKEMGASPGQVRKLKNRFGEKMVEDLADLADEKGITNGFFDFRIGDAIKQLDNAGGQQLGVLRDLATQRGAAGHKAALIKAVRAKLDPKYMKGGSASAHKGAYIKALKDLQNAGDDVASMARKITEVNQDLAAEGAVTLPYASVTRKVMREATRANNEMAMKFMNPQEATRYTENLRNVLSAKIFDKFYGNVFARTMAGRTGPGSIANTVKDIGGRKVMQKIYTKLGRGFQKSEGLGSVKKLSADVLDAVDEALDEVIDEMGSGGVQNKAFGGIVGEMDNYLTPKYGGTA